MIIGLSGYAKSGKDTVAEIIQDLTKSPAPGLHFVNTWEVKKFAGKLKEIASLLTGVPVEMFEDQEFKKQEMPSEWWYKNVYDVGWDKEWSKQSVDYPTNTSTESHIVKTTYRQFLQNLGTEAMRNGLHTNVWVNALFADYTPTHYLIGALDTKLTDGEPVYPNWIITDMRFENELEAVVKHKGITIRVVRYGTILNHHPSETALDGFIMHYEIINNGSIEDLVEKVRSILIKETII